ncbi:MAG: hypothetical protein P9M03_10325, partial [Candidatus Theseobacter exili]|nr:hypothetical protein [Candidatus Theseobacter exili]
MKRFIPVFFSVFIFIFVITALNVVYADEYKPGVHDFSFDLGPYGGSMTSYSFNIYCTGPARVTACWAGFAPALTMTLNGPGKTEYYARVDGGSPLVIDFVVTPEDLMMGTLWQVTVANLYGGWAYGRVYVQFTLPGVIPMPAQPVPSGTIIVSETYPGPGYIYIYGRWYNETYIHIYFPWLGVAPGIPDWFGPWIGWGPVPPAGTSAPPTGTYPPGTTSPPATTVAPGTISPPTTSPPWTGGTLPTFTLTTVPPWTGGTLPTFTLTTVPPWTGGTLPTFTLTTVPPWTGGTLPAFTLTTSPPWTGGTLPAFTLTTGPPWTGGTLPTFTLTTGPPWTGGTFMTKPPVYTVKPLPTFVVPATSPVYTVKPRPTYTMAPTHAPTYTVKPLPTFAVPTGRPTYTVKPTSRPIYTTRPQPTYSVPTRAPG